MAFDPGYGLGGPGLGFGFAPGLGLGGPVSGFVSLQVFV